MKPALSINISAPQAANFRPVSPYPSTASTVYSPHPRPRHTPPTDIISQKNDITPHPFCSRSPSPTALESLYIDDTDTWPAAQSKSHSQSSPLTKPTKESRKSARSHISSARTTFLRKRRTRELSALGILSLLVITITAMVVFNAVWRTKESVVGVCILRKGGERCRVDGVWARCVGMRGLGPCEGEMGEGVRGVDRITKGMQYGQLEKV